jgi:hypothetical protein
VFVDERLLARRKVAQLAEAKAQQDALLDPGVDTPASLRRRVRRSGANMARLKGRAQGKKGGHCGAVVNCGRTRGKIALDGLLKLGKRHGSSESIKVCRGHAEGRKARLKQPVDAPI